MSEIPHHRPVTRGRPPQCLLDVLSRKVWNPLIRGIAVGLPETVCDVLDLYARGQLREIRGLGPRRIGEIEAALIVAGFDLTACRHPVRSRNWHRRDPWRARDRQSRLGSGPDSR